jgi:mycothiol system anti-sigma-R factor
MTKSTCAEVHRKMYRYLDGEIGVFRRWRIRRHLRRCPPCDDGFDFEVKLKDKVRDGCAEEIPRELFDRLMSSLRENDAGGTPSDPTGGG